MAVLISIVKNGQPDLAQNTSSESKPDDFGSGKSYSSAEQPEGQHPLSVLYEVQNKPA